MTESDFTLVNHGSICVLTATSEAASEWIEEHIAGDAMIWAGGIVIEPRFVEAILDGIFADGMTVS